jgi:hypothetical protein
LGACHTAKKIPRRAVPEGPALSEGKPYEFAAMAVDVLRLKKHSRQ